VVTRSGGNALHGSAFEYLRNDVLNAKHLFSQRTDGLKRNQFGFSLGGPVYIPRVYDGRNRTFFFNSYQGTRVRTSASSSLVILPTQAQRNGDFSDVTQQLVDPDTQAAFPGNRIPSSQISSVAKNLFHYLPVPPPLPGYAPGSMFVTFPNKENLFEYLVKIDHQTGYAEVGSLVELPSLTGLAVGTIHEGSSKIAACLNAPSPDTFAQLRKCIQDRRQERREYRRVRKLSARSAFTDPQSFRIGRLTGRSFQQPLQERDVTFQTLLLNYVIGIS
jgi:hypothetical protein